MADASYRTSVFLLNGIRRVLWQKATQLINEYDELLEQEQDPAKQMKLKAEANQKIAEMLKKETASTLNKVLYELSNQMKNAYSRSDA